MLLKKDQYPILIILVVMLLGFTFYYGSIRNYEFLVYIAVIMFFFFLILFTNKKVQYSNSVLWGLTAWALLHMAGGSVRVDGVRLYELILIPITEQIFKYDQFVHIIGFGVATVIMYELLKPLLRPNHRWAALSIVVVMAGLGVGAINEIVEFTATVLVPDTGVGGYVNTSLDLVADLIGAVAAMILIRWKEKP